MSSSAWSKRRLLIRPYLASVSRGEMFIILSGGMAGVAGTVMALYASILGPVVPDALGHILAASFISAPAAIVFAVILVPPEGQPTGQHLSCRRPITAPWRPLPAEPAKAPPC
jgi:CNT family concentrative nucleoside transporter